MANNKYKDLVDSMVEEEGIDQNVATKGGGSGYTPPPEGRAYARIVHYVELGAHYGTYQGKKKDKPDNNVRIVLELSGKNYPPHENEDGTKSPQMLYLELAVSSNEKSRFYKLFRTLNGMHGDKYKHLAQMAADNVPFIVTIKHRKSGEGADAKVYANIWADGAWQITAPVRYDEDDQPVPINVPPATSETLVFLFNRPVREDWNALYIDGTRDDGTSRNFIQEHILEAVNFPGSALEAMLAELPVDGEKVEADKAEAKAASKSTKKAKEDPLGDI